MKTGCGIGKGSTTRHPREALSRRTSSRTEGRGARGTVGRQSVPSSRRTAPSQGVEHTIHLPHLVPRTGIRLGGKSSPQRDKRGHAGDDPEIIDERLRVEAASLLLGSEPLTKNAVCGRLIGGVQRRVGGPEPFSDHGRVLGATSLIFGGRATGFEPGANLSGRHGDTTLMNSGGTAYGNCISTPPPGIPKLRPTCVASGISKPAARIPATSIRSTESGSPRFGGRARSIWACSGLRSPVVVAYWPGVRPPACRCPARSCSPGRRSPLGWACSRWSA